MKQICEGIYVFPHIASNQYLIVDNGGFTLIDTGIPGRSRVILNGISSLTNNNINLSTILVTHADGDHIGSLKAIQSKTQAVSCASEPEAISIGEGTMSRELKPANEFQNSVFNLFSRFFKAPQAKIDRILEPDDILSIAGEMIVVDSSGHTPGHLSFYIPRQRVLFSGDSIFRKNGILIPSYGLNCWDEDRAKQSLERQLELSPKLICGGHGVIWLEE
jgi:glyoxylase-like metal-dependent hydrolase (beta-lactamase superfamily II)